MILIIISHVSRKQLGIPRGFGLNREGANRLLNTLPAGSKVIVKNTWGNVLGEVAREELIGEFDTGSAARRFDIYIGRSDELIARRRFSFSDLLPSNW